MESKKKLPKRIVIALVAGIIAMGMFLFGGMIQWDFLFLASLAPAVILAILACLVTDLRWISAMIGVPVVLLTIYLSWESHDCGFGSGILKGLALVYVGLLCSVLAAIWLIRFIIQRRSRRGRYRHIKPI